MWYGSCWFWGIDKGRAKSIAGLRGIETGAGEGCKLRVYMGMADEWID
jgi:hypothetical protein